MRRFPVWLLPPLWAPAAALGSLSTFALLQMGHNMDRVRHAPWPGVAMASGLVFFLMGLGWWSMLMHLTRDPGSRVRLVAPLAISLALGVFLWLPVRAELDNPFGIRLPWLKTFPGRITANSRAYQAYDLSCVAKDPDAVKVGDMRGILADDAPVLSVGWSHVFIQRDGDCFVSYTVLGGP